MKIELSKKEIGMLIFWNNRCHDDETPCPLMFIGKGKVCEVFDKKLTSHYNKLKSMDDKTGIELDKNEIGIIKFMRDRCHKVQFSCPLHYIDDQAKFCHSITDKIMEMKEK